MKQDWEMKQFEDCLEKVVYTNKIQRKDFLETGDYPIISQEQNFINGYWNNSDDLFEIKRPVIIFGDHTQVLKFVDFDFVLGADGVKILQTKNEIDPRFFYYFLQNIDLGKLGYARHYRLLKEVVVHYPKSLSEQKRIVAILDEVFAAIDKAKANREKNLQNAKELFESYLQSMFSVKNAIWEQKCLDDICTKITDGVHKKPTYVSKGIPFIKINNLTEGSKISFDNVSYISKEDHVEFCKRTKPEKGDILITKDGTIGVVRVIETDIEFSIFVSVALIKPKSKEITPFLRYVLISPLIQNQIKPQGAALKHLYLTDLRKMTVPLPPLSEQQVIVQKLDNLSAETKKLEIIYQQKLNDLEELKKSILQKAFNGELKRKTLVT
jgi:type I restriction enzyme S subunit